MKEKEYIVAVTIARVNAALEMLQQVNPVRGIVTEKERNAVIRRVAGWSEKLFARMVEMTEEGEPGEGKR